MKLLSPADLSGLAPAEEHASDTPIPTQIVASDEFVPLPQTRQQSEVEARLTTFADEMARRHGTTRRGFLRTAAGMAAAFVAMNQVYGPVYEARAAEAADPDQARERADKLSTQFVFDGHTHFLRDDTRLDGFVRMREAVGKAGWNPGLKGKPQTLEDLKYENYFKEIFLDSDTKIAILSSAPSEVDADWFLTNAMAADARAQVNARLGAQRMLCHAIFTPGQPGWLDQVDRAIQQYEPDSFKGYTIGDNTHKDKSRHPWRLDDEKLVYPFYEKIQRAGLRNVCIHKGLFPPSVEKQFPRLREYCDVRDVGRAAKDWPDLNFIIYHAGYRFPGGGTPEEALAAFEATGRIDWVTDLAEIPAKFGVDNVYADLGQVFATTTVAQPKLSAALMGTLMRGLGVERIVWGSDAVWTGSPQWQLEGLRRLEIPEDMRKRHGYAALGPADGAAKRKILGENSARLYGIDPAVYAKADANLAAMKRDYLAAGGERSNLRYGYVTARSRGTRS